MLKLTTEKSINETPFEGIYIEESDGMETVVVIPIDENLYLVSNNDFKYGAGAIFSQIAKDMLYEMTKEKEFFVIPLSVHEMIAVPKSRWHDSFIEDFKNSDVPEEEKLTDKIYEIKV